MTAAAIAFITLVLAGKDPWGRMSGHGRAALPVCASLLLTACDNKGAKADRSALAAGGAAIVIRVEPVDGKAVTENATAIAAAIIEKRLNPTGGRKVFVTSTGDGKLLVEVAGLTVAEAEASKATIQRPARLEFCLVSPDAFGAGGFNFTTAEDTTIKPGFKKVRYLAENHEERKLTDAMTPAERRQRPKPNKFLWVKNKPELSGKSVDYAGAMILPGAVSFGISVELREEFDDKMLAVTKANIGKSMAIIVDGEVISAPTIQSQFGKNFQITGNFTEAEAVELGSQLMNPLENPLTVEKITALPPAGSK